MNTTNFQGTEYSRKLKCGEHDTRINLIRVVLPHKLCKDTGDRRGYTQQLFFFVVYFFNVPMVGQINDYFILSKKAQNITK